MRKASPFSNRKQNKRKRQDDSANGHQDIERGEQAASRVTQIWQTQSSRLNGAHLTPVRKDAKPQQDCASGKGADIMWTQKYWIRRLFYAQVVVALLRLEHRQALQTPSIITSATTAAP
jgi:hypothetical protein